MEKDLLRVHARAPQTYEEGRKGRMRGKGRVQVPQEGANEIAACHREGVEQGAGRERRRWGMVVEGRREGVVNDDKRDRIVDAFGSELESGLQVAE